MGKGIMLDTSKPFGKVLGDDRVSYKQGGSDFDSRKKLIAGSRNSAPALISDQIEAIVTEKKVYVYEDMHIHALKRHLKALYDTLTENEVEFEEIIMGKGAQERIIAFLKEHA